MCWQDVYKSVLLAGIVSAAALKCLESDGQTICVSRKDISIGGISVCFLLVFCHSEQDLLAVKGLF